MAGAEIPDPAADRRSQIVGLGYGILVHICWGVAPLYWKLLKQVGSAEVVAHRVVWSLLTFGLLLVVQSRLGEMRRILRDRRALGAMLASGTFLAINWLAFIYAIETDRVLHASLGYFINPLVAVLLGRLFLRERLRPIELVALIFATAGVVQYTALAGTLPWISLVVAFSFGLYGLVRKTAAVDPLAGSTLESAFLFPICVVLLVYLFASGRGALGHGSASLYLLLLVSGPLTAIPTLWFINAVRRLPLWTMGFLQYLTPTGQFLLAVFVWHEPLTTLHLTSFACIWFGLLVFSVGVWMRLRVKESRGSRSSSPS